MPSKNVIAFGIIAFAIVFSLAFIKFEPKFKILSKTNNLLYPEKTITIVSDSQAQKDAFEDSDKDGLKDWEEDLLGTDKNNPDSDSDGTKDGSEVSLDRNPLKIGDDGNQKARSLVSTSSIPKKSLIGADILSKIQAIKDNQNSGEYTSEDAISELMISASRTFTYDKYLYKGLVIESNPSPEFLKTYGSVVATIQLNLLKEMVENQKSISNDLNVLARIYKDTANNLYKIQVPAQIADIHLQVINNYSVASSAFTALQNYKEDPIKASASVGPFTTVAESHEKLIIAIAKYLSQNGIIYGDNEVGNYWEVFLLE